MLRSDYFKKKCDMDIISYIKKKLIEDIYGYEITCYIRPYNIFEYLDRDKRKS